MVTPVFGYPGRVAAAVAAVHPFPSLSLVIALHFIRLHQKYDDLTAREDRNTIYNLVTSLRIDL